MRRLILLGLLLLVIPAFAQKERERTNSPYDAIRAEGNAGVGTDTRQAYSEDFESFTVGALVPQGGWGSDYSANASVTASGIDGQSARHTSDGSAFSGFEIRSPVFTRDYYAFSQDVRVTASGTTYHVIPADDVNGYFITRVSFDPDGNIYVAEINAGLTGFDFHDTGVDWTDGQVFEVTVETRNDGTFSLYLDGAEVHSGIETNYALTGSPGQIDNCLYWSDNVSSDDTMDIDNLVTNPAGMASIPTLGQWGLGTLVLLLMSSALFIIRKR